mgnify:CR=1 FL=1
MNRIPLKLKEHMELVFIRPNSDTVMDKDKTYLQIKAKPSADIVARIILDWKDEEWIVSIDGDDGNEYRFPLEAQEDMINTINDIFNEIIVSRYYENQKDTILQ